jgi:hypothetical protein
MDRRKRTRFARSVALASVHTASAGASMGNVFQNLVE